MVSQIIEISRATAKTMATTMPAVEILESGLDDGSCEFDCAGVSGGAAEGAAGVEEVDVTSSEDVDDEVLLVVEVEKVVRVRVNGGEEDEDDEVVLVSDVLEEDRIALLVVDSACELVDL